MRIRVATKDDYLWIARVIGKKNLPYCTANHIKDDFMWHRLYCVYEGDKVLATFSLVYDWRFEYLAIKRLCILNKKNEGKGIAKFAIHSILPYLHGKVGVTPWEDNIAMRKVLESEGFHLEYKFNGQWCYYVKECK